MSGCRGLENVSNLVLAFHMIGGQRALGWLCMSPHDIIGLPEAAGQSKADACASVGLGTA